MKSTLLGEEEEKEGANGERVVGCEWVRRLTGAEAAAVVD